MNISKYAKISLRARLDKNHPKGIYIDAYTYIAAGAAILTHDHVYSKNLSTRIGTKCFIGMNSIIMPGVTIGDECVIGAGSIVSMDIPSNCMAAGNPAVIKKRDLVVSNYGIIVKEPAE